MQAVMLHAARQLPSWLSFDVGQNMKPLPVPPKAAAAADSIELLRLWAVRESGQQIVVRHDAWKDPAAWGLALADIARHVARAHAQEGKDESEVFDRILAGFRAEIESPTDDPKGSVG